MPTDIEDFPKFLKFQKWNENRKQTQRSIASTISNLNAQALDALKQQAYIRVNPDLNISPTFAATVLTDITPVIASFLEAREKLNDLMLVSNGTMTVEDMIAKHSIDINQVSSDLI